MRKNNRKSSCSLLSAMIIASGFTPIMLGMIVGQANDDYEIRSNNYRLVGHSTGQQCRPFCLYKNGLVCRDDITWIIENNENKEIKIDAKSGTLSWKDLDSGSHSIQVSAYAYGRHVATKKVNLFINRAIFGPTQLQGYYDQKGSSKKSYQLVDEFGEPASDVDWDVQGIDKTKVKFQKGKIIWEDNLEPETYRFTIIAKKDNKSYQTSATLTIVKNYFIHGDTSFVIGRNFNSNERSKSGSANYQLFQYGQLSKHQNFSWGIRDYDGKYSEKDIKIDQDGKLTWENVVSHTCFRVVAISKNNSQELASLIVRLKVKEYQYEIQGQKEIKSCFGDDGQSNFTFHVGGEQIDSKNVIWEISNVSSYEKEISLNKQTGVLTWKGKIAPLDITFRVWAYLKSDADVITSALCKLCIENLYNVEKTETTFDCTAGKSGDTGDATFVLMKDKVKATNYKTKISDSTIFSYDKNTNRISWNENIQSGEHKVILKFFTMYDWQCQEAIITVNAKVSYHIDGPKNIETDVDRAFDKTYILKDESGERYPNRVEWSIDNKLGGALSIDSEAGILHYDGEAENIDAQHKVIISAKYDDSIVSLEVSIKLKKVERCQIVGGDTPFFCSIDNEGKYETPFKFFNDGAEQNVRWKLKDHIKGVTIDKNTGTISWQKNYLQGKEYKTFIQACKTESSTVLCQKEITIYGNKNRFADTPWSVIAQASRGGWEYIKNCFGFLEETNAIGLKKRIQIEKSLYEVKVVAVKHDERVDGKGKATLTFETEQFISHDSTKEAIECKFYNSGFEEEDPETGVMITKGYNNWEESDLRKIVSGFSSNIEEANGFEITEVYKKNIVGYKKNDRSNFNNTQYATQEKVYLASFTELNGKQYYDGEWETTYVDDGEDVFDYWSYYYHDESTPFTPVSKKDLLGNEKMTYFWTRSPAKKDSGVGHGYVCAYTSGFSAEIGNVLPTTANSLDVYNLVLWFSL